MIQIDGAQIDKQKENIKSTSTTNKCGSAHSVTNGEYGKGSSISTMKRASGDRGRCSEEKCRNKVDEKTKKSK